MDHLCGAEKKPFVTVQQVKDNRMNVKVKAVFRFSQMHQTSLDDISSFSRIMILNPLPW